MLGHNAAFEELTANAHAKAALAHSKALGSRVWRASNTPLTFLRSILLSPAPDASLSLLLEDPAAKTSDPWSPHHRAPGTNGTHTDADRDKNKGKTRKRENQDGVRAGRQIAAVSASSNEGMPVENNRELCSHQRSFLACPPTRPRGGVHSNRAQRKRNLYKVGACPPAVGGAESALATPILACKKGGKGFSSAEATSSHLHLLPLLP